jgi:uroporphyrinogen III methyltransferase/synthase
VIERGTLASQRTTLATLATLAERAADARAPAITLVGPVAGLRERIAWLEARPLHGKTVAVTRARAQASALAERLRGLGAQVVEAPAIAVRPLEASLPDGFDLLCVTSPNGAERLFDLLRDARELAGVTVAAIGPGTARALRAHGIEPDVVPGRAVAEGLVEALEGVPFRHAVIARAAEGRDLLPDALRERGEVSVVALYETVAEPLSDEAREAAASADYLLFTSASSVRFFAAAGGSLSGPRLASIGPATSAELRAHGAEPDLEADPHTPDGLIQALLDDHNVPL